MLSMKQSQNYVSVTLLSLELQAQSCIHNKYWQMWNISCAAISSNKHHKIFHLKKITSINRECQICETMTAGGVSVGQKRTHNNQILVSN